MLSASPAASGRPCNSRHSAPPSSLSSACPLQATIVLPASDPCCLPRTSHATQRQQQREAVRLVEALSDLTEIGFEIASSSPNGHGEMVYALVRKRGGALDPPEGASLGGAGGAKRRGHPI